MIALDTNILVRFLVDDDPLQADVANDLMNHPEGVLIPRTVLLELELVLRHVYRMEAKLIHTGLTSLLGLPQVSVENPALVSQALADFALGMDFADALHLAQAGQATKFYTFDKKFAKLAGADRVALAGQT